MPLVKVHTELRRDWRDAPLAFWVHQEAAGGNWRSATSFEPAAPKPLGKRGYLFLVVDFGRETLEFSSPAQLAHFIEVLSKNPLPTSRRLSTLRGSTAGPNSHWLSRLPASLKTVKRRAQLVDALTQLPPDVWKPAPLQKPRG